MERNNEKETLISCLKNKIELTGFIDCLDSEVDIDSVVLNKDMLGITEHLIISLDEQTEIERVFGSIDNYCEEANIDFVSILKNGEVHFTHITSTSHLQSIHQNGLLTMYSKEVSDLGPGIYAIKTGCDVGLENIKTFLDSGNKKKELLIIQGTYKGPYIECIYKEDHEGYLVLLDDIEPSELTFEIVDFNNFVYDTIIDF